MEIDNVTIFGAGKIGSRLAFLAAVSGYRVIVFEVNTEALGAAKDKLHDLAVRHMQDHFLPEYETGKALGNISYSMTLSKSAAKADIIIETIPSDIGIKMDFYRHLYRCAPDTALLITTAAAGLDELAAESGHPDRFVALRLVTSGKKDTKAELKLLDGTNVKAIYLVIGFLESLGLEVLPIAIQ